MNDQCSEDGHKLEAVRIDDDHWVARCQVYGEEFGMVSYGDDDEALEKRAEAAWKKWGSGDDESTRLDRRGFFAGYRAAIVELGLTRDDVRQLRLTRLDLHGLATRERYSPEVRQRYHEQAEGLNDLADRIEALLPPDG